MTLNVLASDGSGGTPRDIATLVDLFFELSPEPAAAAERMRSWIKSDLQSTLIQPAPPPVAPRALEEPLKRKRGRPRKVPLMTVTPTPTPPSKPVSRARNGAAAEGLTKTVGGAGGRDYWLSPREAAEYVGASVKTMSNWRSLDRQRRAGEPPVGPVYVLYGRSPHYRISDLDAWIAGRLTLPDSSC